MAYSVEFTRAAAKGFKSLPVKEQERIYKIVDHLADAPRPSQARSLKGYEDLLRIRSGNYRLIYRIEDDIVAILVIAVGHRKDVYRKL